MGAAGIFAHHGNGDGQLGDVRRQKELCERALVVIEKFYWPDDVAAAEVLALLVHAYRQL